MYRNPTPPPGPPVNPEFDEYEQRLKRSAKRKRIVIGLIIGSMLLFGVGTCFGPFVLAIGGAIYDGQKTKLTKDEAKHMSDVLDPAEAKAKKSQAAFEAAWPKIRSGEIGARRDLGGCKVDVPGPSIKSKSDDSSSVSLGDSSDSGWAFVDLAPPEAKSPLATLKMPSGSIRKNNVGTDTWQLPPQPLNLAAADKAPQLRSQHVLTQVDALRAEAKGGVERSNHKSFMFRVDDVPKYNFDIEVVVFVDDWVEPKFDSGVKPSTTDDLEALEKGIHPVRTFQSGYAIARAFAWDPDALAVVCASQAVAMNSDDITFRSDDYTPLEQDLVLQLEHMLERNFVAVGDAPPKLTRPVFDDADAGAPAPVDAGAKKPKSPKRH